MQILFQDGVFVDYGQYYLVLGDLDDAPGWEMDDCFAGQVNGLCGAAVPGVVFLMASRTLGEVPLTVELHADEPVVPDWEEVVEVSFAADRPVIVLPWGEHEGHQLDLPPGTYRLRYCADQMRVENRTLFQEGATDRYLMQFWPAEATPDTIVRRTSQEAQYWHDFAREVTARRAASEDAPAREQPAAPARPHPSTPGRSSTRSSTRAPEMLRDTSRRSRG